MEYLVTMTTQVPDGTPDEAVDAIRAREATRSAELAREGHLLRLWRPPLQPGEWRTFGLFAADGDKALEKSLASMPLRVWRTDTATPLSPHPNDPGPRPRPAREPAVLAVPEYFTTFTLTIPAGTPASLVADGTAREAERVAALADLGHLVRLWRLPADGEALGLWRATERSDLDEMLASLPLAPWLTVETLPLSRHPSDPPS
jgi:muconolactone delta-isomerase